MAMEENKYGLNFSYQTFCDYLPRITGASSSPANAPLIKRILGCYPNSTIYGVGSHSALLSISGSLCVKVSYKPGGEHIIHEQEIFRQLESIPCSSISHALYCAPDLIFMELYKNGTLHERLSSTKAPRPVLQWMQQLSEAVACLEALGYAQRELSPRNIMFTEDDNLRLVDFDHSLKLGEDLEVGDYPLCSSHKHGGRHGTVRWYLWHTRVNLLVHARTCPDMDLEDPVNRISRDCWTGRFDSVAALAACIRRLVYSRDLEQKKSLCEQHSKLICG
ncbi:serine/threonine protein kinase [Trichophyton equinum CBS 127.97]|uniref:Serine/threonine protein kinase n=1 Tax=Trichophyton equinum (strain ATCC MYA-4606 / CBS 127.97) TaxID=559882 RepID=F2PGW3_TRIEC|nr:serine/threonine protein kinase [Trichophyton equinum CBS 127.97]